jgi:hypothetical protein
LKSIPLNVTIPSFLPNLWESELKDYDLFIKLNESAFFIDIKDSDRFIKFAYIDPVVNSLLFIDYFLLISEMSFGIINYFSTSFIFTSFFETLLKLGDPVIYNNFKLVFTGKSLILSTSE